MNELLRHSAFVRFWFARIAANAGTQMLFLAVGWHMYELTRSAWDLGMVGLFQFAPALASTLIAGHVADRWHRARLVATCMLVQTAAALVLVWLTLHDGASRESLLVLSLVLGGIRPFQMAAQQALVPMLVPASLLARAMAISSAGLQVSVIAGPAIGGLLFAAGVNAIYIACTLLFCVAAIMCYLVKYEHVVAAPEPVTARTLLAGVRFIGTNRLLLGAASLDLFAVLLGGATALLPIFARDILEVGPQGLGLLRSAPAVGSLFMGIYLARHPLISGVGRKLLISVAIYGLCMVAFGLSRSFLFSLAILALSGCADTISVVIRHTLTQLETPDHMRGRVAAANTLFIGSGNQLGEFESGVTAAAFGPVPSVVLGGIGTICVSIAWARLFKPLALRQTLN
jgi:MFS family permease